MAAPPEVPARLEIEGILHSLVIDAYGNPPGLWPIEVLVDDGGTAAEVQVWAEQAEQILYYLFQRFGAEQRARLLGELAALAARGV